MIAVYPKLFNLPNKNCEDESFDLIALLTLWPNAVVIFQFYRFLNLFYRTQYLEMSQLVGGLSTVRFVAMEMLSYRRFSNNG